MSIAKKKKTKLNSEEGPLRYFLNFTFIYLIYFLSISNVPYYVIVW